MNHPTRVCTDHYSIYHEAIALHLNSSGFKVIIANSGKAKKFSQSLGLIHKTDKSDSYMLARYGYAQCEHISFWEPEPINLRVIKALVRRLSALEKDRRRESNRLEASAITDSCERVLSSIHKIIHILDEDIRDIENEIYSLILACPVMKHSDLAIKQRKVAEQSNIKPLIILKQNTYNKQLRKLIQALWKPLNCHTLFSCVKY